MNDIICYRCNENIGKEPMTMQPLPYSWGHVVCPTDSPSKENRERLLVSRAWESAKLHWDMDFLPESLLTAIVEGVTQND